MSIVNIRKLEKNVKFPAYFSEERICHKLRYLSMVKFLNWKSHSQNICFFSDLSFTFSKTDRILILQAIYYPTCCLYGSSNRGFHKMLKGGVIKSLAKCCSTFYLQVSPRKTCFCMHSLRNARKKFTRLLKQPSKTFYRRRTCYPQITTMWKKNIHRKHVQTAITE